MGADEDEEPNDDDDRYIKIPQMNNNANNIEASRVDADAQLPDDNYYPPDFHAEAADNDMPEPVNDAIPIDDPNDNDIPVIETVEDGEDLRNPLEHAMDEQYGARTGVYNLRPRCGCDYSHLHATIAGTHCKANHTYTETVMTQHTLKKGLEIFGEAGVEAVLTEMKQLHDCEVMEPKFANDLSHEE